MNTTDGVSCCPCSHLEMNSLDESKQLPVKRLQRDRRRRHASSPANGRRRKNEQQQQQQHVLFVCLFYGTTFCCRFCCVFLPLVVTSVSPYTLVIRSVGSFRNTLDFSAKHTHTRARGGNGEILALLRDSRPPAAPSRVSPVTQESDLWFLQTREASPEQKIIMTTTKQ